jgi:hypothetical protein
MRWKLTIGSRNGGFVIGPGTYHRESSLLKPTFNRKAGEHVRKEEFVQQSPLPIKVERSTLLERRSVSEAMGCVLRSTMVLDKLIAELQVGIHEQIDELIMFEDNYRSSSEAGR